MSQSPETTPGRTSSSRPTLDVTGRDRLDVPQVDGPRPMPQSTEMDDVEEPSEAVAVSVAAGSREPLTFTKELDEKSVQHAGEGQRIGSDKTGMWMLVGLTFAVAIAVYVVWGLVAVAPTDTQEQDAPGSPGELVD